MSEVKMWYYVTEVDYPPDEWLDDLQKAQEYAMNRSVTQPNRAYGVFRGDDWPPADGDWPKPLTIYYLGTRYEAQGGAK